MAREYKVGDIVELVMDGTGKVCATGKLERDIIPDEYPEVIIGGKWYSLTDEGATYYLRLAK